MNKTVLYSLIGLVVVIVMGGGVIFARRSANVARQTEQQPSVSQSGAPTEAVATTTRQTATSNITWQQAESGWKAMGGTPPACPTPFTFAVPADLSKATGILYPGQTRGGNYKPHGGIRFDNSQNSDITVTAPYAAQVVRGARFLVDGEIQYTFDFMTDCGMMYRLGHLLVLTPKFQQIADKFSAAAEGDSRTNLVNPAVAVSLGEKIATSVGVTKGGVNTFFDWGVYNMLAKNAISSDASWTAQHANDVELAPHAVCWFDWLSAADEAAVRSLPAGDPTSGKTSDYCK